jgi:prophage antirepressor-like protein
MELIKQIDETISFNEKNIRVIGSYEEPWFVVKDICEILEIKDNRSALRVIPEKWKDEQILPSLGGKQITSIINEAGLYKLIMRSNKPVSQKFQEVVCEEILPSLRKKGEYKIQSILDKNNELEQEKIRLQNEKQKIEDEKNAQIKILEDKIVDKQKRVRYKDKNCIYILTTDIHLQNRTYIIGESVNLTNRLTSYNKTFEHSVVYTKGCKSIEHMHVVEKMVLYKLDKYREKANRDRFILPQDKDISFFINIVNDAINWFDDVEEYVREYTEEELSLTKEELQEKYTQNIEERQIELKFKKSETDRIYRENNKEKKSEIDRTYRENNIQKITQHKKEYYENNKEEILTKQKERYENNKEEILARQREYHENNKEIINEVRKIYRKENNDKIKEQKKIYREKYKDEINRKQNEKKKLKENPLIECECGIKLKIETSKSKKHLNSKAHKKYLEDGIKTIKEKI